MSRFPELNAPGLLIYLNDGFEAGELAFSGSSACLFHANSWVLVEPFAILIPSRIHYHTPP